MSAYFCLRYQITVTLVIRFYLSIFFIHSFCEFLAIKENIKIILILFSKFHINNQWNDSQSSHLRWWWLWKHVELIEIKTFFESFYIAWKFVCYLFTYLFIKKIKSAVLQKGGNMRQSRIQTCKSRCLSANTYYNEHISCRLRSTCCDYILNCKRIIRFFSLVKEFRLVYEHTVMTER